MCVLIPVEWQIALRFPNWSSKCILLITDWCTIATIYYLDIPICVLICVYHSSNGHADKVEKSLKGPKLCNDPIGEWPNYIRLVLPILYIPIDKKTTTNPVQWLYTTH